MAKRAYIGIDGAARKVRKGYTGVDDATRKLKKAYIGVGGVARPCWSGGELVHYGTITPLREARLALGAASNRSYAVFGGGTNTAGTRASTVDAYGTSSVGEYALIAGGYTTGENVSAAVNAYSAGLIIGAGQSLCGPGIHGSSESGGLLHFWQWIFWSKWSNFFNQVDFYNADLTHTTSSLPQKISDCRGGSTPSYVSICGGGNASGGSSAVYAYDNNLTIRIPENMTAARLEISSASIGDNVIICGGLTGSGITGVVDTYNDELTNTRLADLISVTACAWGTSIGDFGIIAGGFCMTNPYTATDVVSVCDDALSRIAHSMTLSSARGNIAAASIGNFAVFGGGCAEVSVGTAKDAVDAFTLI